LIEVAEDWMIQAIKMLGQRDSRVDMKPMGGRRERKRRGRRRGNVS